jgi:mono/diheme cytochrome c family protein
MDVIPFSFATGETVYRTSLAVLTVLVLAAMSSHLGAAPTAAQRSKAKELESAVQKAANLYSNEKFKECGEVLAQVQQDFEKAAADGNRDMLNLLENIYPRLMRAHALLTLEGVRLPPLKKPGEAAPSSSGSAPAAGGISFVKDVAPMLVTKCGRCHVNEQRGMFSMATYENLMKGTPDGVVLFPGQAEGHRIVEVIESGDMPRGGGRVSEPELASLKKWIAEGAKFDGPDPNANLATLANAPAKQEPAKVEVAAATGNEKVSFSRDLAPVLVQECANCHGYGRQPAGRLNLTTFRSLLTGGDSGAPVMPGQAAESLLIKKLKGQAGDRMPLRRPPLSDAVIAQFETWIAEGARFDGPDPATDVKRVADLYRAANSNHEQLSTERAKLAEQNWRLAMPTTAMEKAETQNFLLVGNVGENTLKDIGEKAEALAPKVAEVFKAPEGQPLVKGRVTLFVFGQGYDYSEFGQMVEKRELPREWRGHWRFDTLDAYGSVVVPRGDEYSLEGIIAQQVAGVYVASLGDSPQWFREGAARVAASRLMPDDPRIKTWETTARMVIHSMSQPDDFMQGKLAPEAAAIASYSYLKFLMGRARQFDVLLDALRRGGKFDDAFAQAYRGTPIQGTAAWVAAAR